MVRVVTFVALCAGTAVALTKCVARVAFARADAV
jgi:hypothetical protein